MNTIILDEYIELLKQEVKWCNSKKAKKVDMPQDFKDGFLSGIKQAILFAEKLKQEVEDESHGN